MKLGAIIFFILGILAFISAIVLGILDPISATVLATSIVEIEALICFLIGSLLWGSYSIREAIKELHKAKKEPHSGVCKEDEWRCSNCQRINTYLRETCKGCGTKRL